MNYNRIAFTMAGAWLLGGPTLLHADDNSRPDTDRVQLGYRMAWNMLFKLHNVAAPVAANNPSVTGKSYADGFVGTDDTGNVGGYTANWSGGKVVDNNNYLLMHYSGAGELGSSLDNDENNGLELTWNHELVRFDKARLGFELAFNWGDVSVKHTYAEPLSVAGVDAFNLAGLQPPSGYPGHYTTGFGQGDYYLPSSPDLTLPITVAEDFDANLYGFRLGPYLDVPLGKRLLFTLSAGVALTLVDCQFRYVESYTTPGGTRMTSNGDTADFGAVVGAYVGVQGSVKLTDHLNLFTGLQYQGSENYEVTTGTKKAELDFGQALYWTLGLSYSF